MLHLVAAMCIVAVLSGYRAYGIHHCSVQVAEVNVWTVPAVIAIPEHTVFWFTPRSLTLKKPQTNKQTKTNPTKLNLFGFFFLFSCFYDNINIHVKPKSRDLTLRLKPILRRSTLAERKILLVNSLIFPLMVSLPEFNWTWLLVLKYGAFSAARNPEQLGQRLGTPQLKLMVFKFQVLHMGGCFCFYV